MSRQRFALAGHRPRVVAKSGRVHRDDSPAIPRSHASAGRVEIVKHRAAVCVEAKQRSRLIENISRLPFQHLERCPTA